MGRKRLQRNLDVFVGKSKVGRLIRAPNGAVSFRYGTDWLSSTNAFPISLSIPLSDRKYAGARIINYFEGLLPDDLSVRETIAARVHAESTNAFDLLAAIGRDCVGALRFVPESVEPAEPNIMRYQSVNDQEIEERLANLSAKPLGLGRRKDNFRISIAGMQQKTAFLWAENQWQLPLGATPTSHIFKPAIGRHSTGADLSDSPWNEWLCLKICSAYGLVTANAQILQFGDRQVIVVERFDRIWREGILYRLPQEDLCQAMGISPTRKYQNEGGPGILDIMKCLNGAIAPYQERLKFLKIKVLFWMLTAIDGHAKNFSIMITPDGYYLTPLYDVMSVAPYLQFPVQKVKMAMSVGDRGIYRLNQISARHFRQTGRGAGLIDEDIDKVFGELVEQTDKVLIQAEHAAAKAGVAESTSSPILEGVSKRARILNS